MRIRAITVGKGVTAACRTACSHRVGQEVEKSLPSQLAFSCFLFHLVWGPGPRSGRFFFLRYFCVKMPETFINLMKLSYSSLLSMIPCRPTVSNKSQPFLPGKDRILGGGIWRSGQVGVPAWCDSHAHSLGIIKLRMRLHARCPRGH